MESETICALHAIVEGRVQGVGYRMFVQRTAEALGLTGWVRNKFDGRVEVWSEGSMLTNLQLLENLRQGPPSSFVLNVDTFWEIPLQNYYSFSVKSTE